MVLLVLLIIIEALRICLSWRSEGDSNPRAACDDYTLSRLSILTRNRLSYTILLIISFLLSRNLRT